VEVAKVNNIELNLYSWHRLYVQLEAARLRLEQLRATPEVASNRAALEAEVSRLQQETDSQLEAVNAALAAARQPVTGVQPVNC
jgi:hypothetical protein